MEQKMNVYSKLQKVRVELQSKNLKKTGLNKFSGYSYFETKDFLPTVNELFMELGLCSFFNFGKEEAKLTIVNTENPQEIIEFTAQMASASLKGCHEIQNRGAEISYMTRYLWISCLNICESDTLDAVTGNQNTYTEPQKVQLSPQEAGAVVTNFGKYNGKTLKEIYKVDKDYFMWLADKAQKQQIKDACKVMLQALQTKAPTKEEFEELGNDCPF